MELWMVRLLLAVDNHVRAEVECSHDYDMTAARQAIPDAEIERAKMWLDGYEAHKAEMNNQVKARTPRPSQHAKPRTMLDSGVSDG